MLTSEVHVRRQRKRILTEQQVTLHRREQCARLRARKLGCLVEVVDYEAILNERNWTCHICGYKVDLDVLQMDHVIPLVRNGSHTKDNLLPAHSWCNVLKKDKLEPFSLDWTMVLGSIEDG